MRFRRNLSGHPAGDGSKSKQTPEHEKKSLKMQDFIPIIPIKGPAIPYLDTNHLKSHFNVTLVAENGSKIMVNNLQMAAFSRPMLEALIDNDEDTIITTNLDQDDLIMVANFITEGLLPMPCEELQNSMPDHVAKTFLSFGIFLKDVLNKDQQVLIIKKEELEDLDELEQETLFDDLSDENLPLIKSTPKKKQRRVKRENSESEDSRSNDEDWNPRGLAKKKKKVEVDPEDKKPKRWIILTLS